MWTWEHKCQSVTQLNALLPSFKVVMIAYCRGEWTGKVEQLECVCVWERVFAWVKIHRIIAGATMCANVCVCVCANVCVRVCVCGGGLFDPPPAGLEVAHLETSR